jgi:hypothetical protein
MAEPQFSAEHRLGKSGVRERLMLGNVKATEAKEDGKGNRPTA